MRRRPNGSSARLVALGVGTALTIVACASPTTPEPVQPNSDVTRVVVDPQDAVALPDLVSAADTLGLDLLAASGEVTTVTSPASLQVALSMLAEGADGATLSQLEALVGATGQERRDGMNALVGTLADLEGDPAVASGDELPGGPVVHRASRLLVDDSLAVQQSFVDALARSYDADARTTDLAGEQARGVLDAWVEEHTGGLVPRSAVTPGPDLRIVLQDAIVLAARWDQPFAAELTQPYPFTLTAGDQVNVAMLNTGEARDTAYADAQGWQAVRLPYVGGRLAAEVILPPSGVPPTDLSLPLLHEIQRGLDTGQHRQILLRMPVVGASSSLDLMRFLGERAPASLEGGLGGIADEQLAVSQAVQQGVLSIDEAGTLAAAVTEMGVAGAAPAEPPFVLVVDRPYLVRIADGQTGWALFLVHVSDPRGQR